MRAAWPVWNNENPLPGPAPRAWVPVVIHNSANPVPGVAAPGASFLDSSVPNGRGVRWVVGPLASFLAHAGAIAAGLFLFLPADDTLDIQGSAVEVEIISMQTVASNEASDVQSDATESMVSAGSEIIEATEPETLDPVEAETTPPLETLEPVETEMAEAKVVEAVEPVQQALVEPTQVPATVEPAAPEALPPATTPQALDAAPIEPVTAEPVEPVQAATPPAPTVEPSEPRETVEAAEPFDPNAPPVPQTRTVAQRQEPTYPKAEAKPPAQPKAETPSKAQPQKPKPSTGGNGGNSNADAKAGAPASGQQATGAQGNSAEVTKYPGKVLSKLRRALRYPSGGRGTGEVAVEFTVSAGGAASRIRVVASSGNPVFDNAAIETVKRAAPFPAIPGDAGRDSWTFTFPLGFVR